MKISTTKNKYVFIFVWIAIWQVASLIISQDILLVSPVKVLFRLLELIFTIKFYISVGNSIFRILIGFLLALVLGVILAIYSNKHKLIYEFFIIPINIIKVTPVASFIILALIWVDSTNLSMLVAFIITLPVFFLNIYNGFKNIDRQMIEMTKIFRFTTINKIKYIYIPHLKPFFIASVSVGISLAFKSGIAGEVIGIVNNTIGGNLQNAKILLETTDVFCWTIVIIIVSIFLEKYSIKLINKVVEVLNND